MKEPHPALFVTAGLLALVLSGCSARDPVDKTPVFHVGTPTNRSSVNSWEIGSEPLYTQPGVNSGKAVHLTPIASQRGFEPDDPVALAVLSALNRDGKISTAYLSASAENGIVILIGSVPNARQKARAEWITSHISGVKAVRSKVEIVQ